MSDAGAEIRIVAFAHQPWLAVAVELPGGSKTAELILDTGSPITAVSTGLFRTLAELGALTEIGPRRFIARGLGLAGHSLPPVELHVSRTATRLGIEGMLGLNFFALFSEIRFKLETLELLFLR